MIFPLNFWDVSLLITITAIILLITSELLSPRYGEINIRIDRRRLKIATLAFSLLFLGTVGLMVVDLIFST
jgi:hypothetical protein